MMDLSEVRNGLIMIMERESEEEGARREGGEMVD